jgi:WD40 repeat protein
VTFSPDGETVAVGFADGSVRIRNVMTGEEAEPLKGHVDGADHISFSDDGRLMAVTGGNGSISVWHLKERKLLDRLERDWNTGKVAFAPGGERLAFGSSDGTVRLYDWKTRTETKIRDFDSTPTSLKQEFQLGPVRWSDNGRTLTAMSANGTLREWGLA